MSRHSRGIKVKLSLKNVARVSSADIELNGITLIAGLNGSGKSTICKTLSAMYNACGELGKKVSSERLKDARNKLTHWCESKISDPFDVIVAPEEILDKLSKKGLNLENAGISELKEATDHLKIEASETSIADLHNGIQTCFTLSHDPYVRLIITRAFQSEFKGQISTISSSSEPTEISLSDEGDSSRMLFETHKLSSYRLKTFSFKNVVYIKAQSCLDYVDPAYSSVLNPYSEFAHWFNDADSNLSLQESLKLEKATDLASKIANEVTHGKLEKDKVGNLYFNEQETDAHIMIGNVASGMKIFLMLQKMLENGTLADDSLLIIDEPEVNLHPSLQVTLAEILVKMQKELGMTMLLNTHSPYFTRSLEVNAAENGRSDVTKFYFMTETDKNIYTATDVTDDTEIIYKTMYQPLEGL